MRSRRRYAVLSIDIRPPRLTVYLRSQAAQILSRRDDSNSSTPAQGVPIVTPPKPNSPAPSQHADYSTKPQPPLPLQTIHRPTGPGFHRNTLTAGGGRSPLQSPYSPAGNNRLGPGPPPALQAGSGSAGPYQRRASTPTQPGGDGALWPLFQAVDVRGQGQLAATELSQALKNSDYSAFDPATVSMMIRMHDHDRSGTIGFSEFWYALFAHLLLQSYADMRLQRLVELSRVLANFVRSL